MFYFLKKAIQYATKISSEKRKWRNTSAAPFASHSTLQLLQDRISDQR